MTTILSFIFVLGVLIFVHELGHFLMARRIGVRVLTFSLGFGPKLLKFTRGGTEYCISAIPLGGYVKMAGENPDDARTGAPDEFLSKSKWQRFQVLVMGPVMNIALAIVVMAGVIYQGVDVPLFEEQPVVVGSVVAGSAGEEAGIRPGDRILSIAGEDLDNWKEFPLVVGTRANRTVPVVLLRDGNVVETKVTPRSRGKFEIGDIGVLPQMEPQVIGLNSGEAAVEAGLRVGDIVLAVGGERNVGYQRIVDIIQASQGKPVPFEIRRSGQILQVTVTPRIIDGVPRVGARFSAFERRIMKPGPVESFTLSVKQNWEWTSMIMKTLGGLFMGETPVKQLMGPVGIAQLSATAAEEGWIPLLSLLAMISLNLGFVNLLPVPVLDGGHIAILALEGLSRRDFSMKVKEKMLLAGFVLLVMLMVTVIYNDLTRVEWLGKLMPWR